VKPRFEVYKAVSQQIREIFAEHTPIIEPLSLDEAYLDVTENLQGIPLARDIAHAIRARIKEVTGLNASAGISYDKFLAKLASDHRKPNGQYVISPDMGPAFVEALPVGKFHGIGPATSAKMDALGLHTGQVSRLYKGLCETVGLLMAVPSPGRQVAVVPRTESTHKLALRLAILLAVVTPTNLAYQVIHKSTKLCL
jgi:hypothetical protein